MNRIIIYTFYLTSTLLISCNNPPEAIQKDAEALCNCFKQIYAVDPEKVEEVAKMNGQMEECNKMWKEIYDKYKDDVENKKAFNKAYNTCQDEK